MRAVLLDELTRVTALRGPAARTYIYVVRQLDAGPVKIGKAANPALRLAGLQSANPWSLNLLALLFAPARFEGALHGLLASYRIHGEWFLLPDDVLDDLLAAFIDRDVVELADPTGVMA